ncbi:hypothetical protein L195_g052366 [Trifolium pratense]|uniref:Uncharacterized protein n=1 Tax=Trifolium pratense TaxID=57577 RepID=A0A2K3K4Q9_TRIPR|nr:hypothetical protein L195_g052366 [Trifolium pratense]
MPHTHYYEVLSSVRPLDRSIHQRQRKDSLFNFVDEPSTVKDHICLAIAINWALSHIFRWMDIMDEEVIDIMDEEEVMDIMDDEEV